MSHGSVTWFPVTLSHRTPESTELKISCTSLLLAAGPWTARVYESLFPTSKLKIPISNLAGWSVVFRDPTSANMQTETTSLAPCHAVFTTSAVEKFAPELFTRILSTTSNGGAGRDIYLAGLNSSDISLPAVATEVDQAPDLHDPQIASILRAAKVIISSSPATGMMADGHDDMAKDTGLLLDVLSTGLCHRPVTPSGKPIITRMRSSALYPRYDIES